MSVGSRRGHGAQLWWSILAAVSVFVFTLGSAAQTVRAQSSTAGWGLDWSPHPNGSRLGVAYGGSPVSVASRVLGIPTDVYGSCMLKR